MKNRRNPSKAFPAGFLPMVASPMNRALAIVSLGLCLYGTAAAQTKLDLKQPDVPSRKDPGQGGGGGGTGTGGGGKMMMAVEPLDPPVVGQGSAGNGSGSGSGAGSGTASPLKHRAAPKVAPGRDMLKTAP